MSVWLMLLVILMVLGGFAALLALVVTAIVNNRPGILVAIGGLLLVVLGIGLLSLIGYRSARFVPEGGHWHVGPTSVGHDFHVDFDRTSDTLPTPVSVRVSWLGLLFFVGLPLAILFALFRRAGSKQPTSHSCGRSGWVSAIVALAVIGFMLLAGAKWLFATRQVARARQHEMVARQSAEAHAQILRKQSEMQRQAAEMNSKLQRQIAETDIHELMDKVDAPRISISPTPTPPAAPTAPPPPEPVDAGLDAEVKAALAVIAEDELSTGEASAAESSSGLDSAAADADATDHESETKAEEAAETESGNADGKDTSKKKEDRPKIDQAADPTVEEFKESKESAESVTSESKDEASDPPKREAAAIEAAAEPSVEAKPATSGPGVPALETWPAAVSTASRPSWIDDAPKRTGDTWREVVVTEEYADPDECYAAANVYLMIKTYEHLQMLVRNQSYAEELPSITFRGNTILANGNVISHDRGKSLETTLGWGDGRLNLMRTLGIGIDYIRREIVPDGGEYLESVERSFGPMKKLYTQMEFTPSVNRELRARWEAHERKERLAAVGAGAGGVLGLLSIVYGLLKVDTWTKGYYTKRLFLGVPAAIIGLVTLLALASY